MTGYGQAQFENNQASLSVEIKTINAKQADISMRLPKVLAAYEVAWRNQLATQLGRGKIVLTATYTRKEAAMPTTQVNEALFTAYYERLQALAHQVDATVPNLFQLALHSADVITATATDTSQEVDIAVLDQVLRDALQQCQQSRTVEGAALTKQLQGCLKAIRHSLAQVEALDPLRGKALRERLQEGLKVAMTTHTLDQGRLEQELFYYTERLDIAEEKVRLAQHLAYFEEVMQSDQAVGKKLGFIAQEIGREINTIGSKANDTAIQKQVILMKEELEKIKEQLCNVW